MKKVLSRIKEKIKDILNFIKKHKKKVLIGLAVFIILFLPTFLYINLTNPTLINKYIASVANKGMPANNAFEDQVFYNEVVDEYNKKNDTNLPYTTNLTDEQLKTITEIDYSGYGKEDKIISTKGIEKLTSLKSLGLNNNNLNSIDLSQNTSLTSLGLNNNNLNSIDLSQNTSLTSLGLNNNNLNSIDLSQNTSLTNLGLNNNNLNSIDLGQNTSLKSLDLGSNNLNSIDLSQNTSLTSLVLDYNNLSSIDLSQNTSLTNLDLYSNNLNSIDLSNNTLLTKLELGFNNLSSIDLSNNTLLTSLKLGNNNLSSIDLSQNIKLKYLYLNYNPFTLGIYRMMLGTTVNSDNNIKLPEGSDKFYITYEIDDENIASYNDSVIKGLKLGTTKLKAILNGCSSSGIVVEGVIKVFDIESDKYKINKENKYIYTKMDTDDSTIMKNITVENGTGKIENNEFKVMDEDVVVETYKLVNISSDKYDLSKDYIYTGYNIFNTSDIKVTNVSVELSNNYINIKYNNEVLDSYKLVSYSSSKYNLDKEYIYVGSNEFSKDDISLTNLTSTLSNDILQIKYGNDVKASYKIVSISSGKYDLSNDNIRLNKDETFDIESVNIINGQLEYMDNKLYVKYDEEVLKVYTITTRAKGDVNNDDKITIVDVSLLYRHVKKKSVITDSETLGISDINGDNKITVTDVSMIYRYVKGKIDEL